VLRVGQWDYTTPGGNPRSVENTPDTVRWLRDQVARFHPHTPFRCLSDVDIDGVDTIPLRHDWPGWWAKMELFRYGPLLYLDLDTVLTAPIGDLLEAKHALTLCGPFSDNAGPVNSSVMAWDTPPVGLYETFARSPEKWMKLYQGDQDFIADQILECDLWQDRFPNAVQSYKKLDGPPTPIVCFHGKPKPHEVSEPWLN
jgi:hypothetical protein